MTIRIQGEYEKMPAYVKWTKNYYVLAGMLVLCSYNLIAQLSTQVPDEISTGWTIAHVMMIGYWLYQVKIRRRMDREARVVTDSVNKALEEVGRGN